MPRISKRSIDELIASGASGDVIRDDNVKGFQARLNANGSVSYLVEYRAGRGRGFPVRRPVLGHHGALTPDQARSLAKNALASVLAGQDPAARASEPPNGNDRRRPSAPCARDPLAAEAKPSTAKNFAAMIERTLIPEFGSKRLSELTRAQVRAWHARQPIGRDKPISTWRSCARRSSSRLVTG